MKTRINLFSNKEGEINRFLSSFFNIEMGLEKQLIWKKTYNNPIEITELIGVFIDNTSNYDLNLWISLDNDVYIKVSNTNANSLIKYIFERFPY